MPGVTTGDIRPELAAIAVPSTYDGHNMMGDDFAITADWGHFGTGDAVMPGRGRTEERPYTDAEHTVLGDAADVLGQTTFDIHLNDNARWSNVPAAVWDYKLGGYQVLKKWLSYREHKVLGRPLTPEEVPALHRHGSADRGNPAAHWKVSCAHAVSHGEWQNGGARTRCSHPWWESTPTQAMISLPVTRSRCHDR